MKRFTFIAFLLLFGTWLAAADTAQAEFSGSLIKASSTAVYYVWEGKRYVFPNERIFFSWYENFDLVKTVADTELASYLIGGNVTYRPGSKLVKIKTDPKVYAVGAGGVLRWITSEEVATTLYGPNWNKEVDDVSDAYFLDYRHGDAVAIPQDFDRTSELATVAIFQDITAGEADPDESMPITFRAKKSGRWSDRTTWEDGKIPVSGSEVTIPIGTEVVYGAKESGNLKSLNIDGSLVFDSAKTTFLTAKMISVSGRLAVGTADEPIAKGQTATIFLTGASNFTIADDGLRVAGLLEMHGTEPLTDWTRLSETVEAGAMELIMEQEVDWKEGDVISIAPGARNPEETEVRVILSVDGVVVTLDAPLSFSHRGDDVLRSEVGLLTRNVKLKGMGEGMGSYVAVSGRAQARISGVEFSKLGRTGVAGHSAMYFDGLGSADDSYIRSSSIVDSGNRCATIRQTRGLEITRLVAANVKGFCLAAEDGSETGLMLKDNLIMGVFSGDDRTGDTVPAGILLRNPDAFVEGNTVAGSVGYGYWYDLPKSVVKSDGSLLRPRETALASFSGNTAHSNAETGLFVDDAEGKMNYSPAEKAVFTGFRGIMNNERGFWMRGSNLEVSNAYLADNRIGGTFAAFGAEFNDSLVIGDPDAPDMPEDGTELVSDTSGEPMDNQFGFTFFDGPVSVSNVTFRNFVSTATKRASAFSFHPKNENIPDPRNSYESVTFDNANEWFVHSPEEAGDYLAVVKDLDTSETRAGSDPFLNVNCLVEDGDTVMTCPGHYSQILTVFRDAPGNEAVYFERLDTGAVFTLRPGPAFDGKYAYMTIAEGPGYRIYGPTTRSITVDFVGSLQPVLLRFQAPETASIRVNGFSAGLAPWPDLVPGEYGYDSGTGEVVVYLPADGFSDITW